MLFILLGTLLTAMLGRILPSLNQISFVNDPEEHDEYSPRIAYGAPADITDYPYFVGLSRCGGAIISKEWVVTAAHCVHPLESSGDYVLVGGSSQEKSVFVKIENIIVHPYYVPSILLNDIALIKLAVPLEYKETVQPLELPSEDQNLEFGSTHVFIGRGADESGKQSEQLMKIEVKIYPSDVCYRESYPILFETLKPFISWLKGGTICSERVEKLPGAGPGDSGSPMVKDNVLIGIASFATAPSNTRTLFLTNVAHYIPWINSVIGGIESTYDQYNFSLKELENNDEPEYWIWM